ncbi:family 20 glycosylhydrolase [Hymenobacter sp. GOD-10R]|uniref:family 20 glycosylhydrolase n=1 Tax=Hymenobacter sp. GOD-10R TaxID=3093922 RepID=UPI002D796199|nr:family 20 glycosylhydrolase [Hymenobacter sp. GOD-10R]WRQ30270.1 family 20 glycosylhydrolase [Hymenobacter sp. GOD-10R]
MKPTLPIKTLFCLLFSLLCGGGAAAQSSTDAYALIPYPTSLVPASGSFTITNATKLALPGEAKRFAQEAEQLQGLLTNNLGQPLKKTTAAAANTIVLVYDKSIAAPEAYRLTITPQQVTLTAKEPAGMFRAMQTVRQLLPATIEKAQKSAAPLRLPALQIQDQPAYSWRGMHLDVARHFFSLDYLRKYIDLLALYKFNKLHLHLTDDQGWRLEIKKYPDLTTKGAWRTFNNQDSSCIRKSKDNSDFALEPKHLRQRNGQTEYGGFYTQQQMKDLIAFAAARHIEIIPEVDMPGHMMAAIKAYPFLTCTGNVGWGKEFSVPLCPCNESTYEFTQNVLSEVAALFPSQYIHIGADEVEKTTWAQAGVCTELMQKEGLKNVNELQSYFVRQIEKFLQSKGKKMIGWDEVLDGGVDASATVMYWRSWVPDAPAKAARNGNQVIMTTNNPLYFDYLPDKNSVDKVYHFEVAPKDLGPEGAKAILGAQANLWTEQVPSENRADYMVMPRMTALAEVVWTNKSNYTSYQQRLKQHYARLAELNVHYRVPDLAGFAEESVFTTSTNLTVQKPLANLILHYTTDGSAPTDTSPVLTKPLPINKPTTVKLAAFTPEGLKGDTYTINYKQQTYAEPTNAKATEAGLKATYFEGYFKAAARMQEATAKGSTTVQAIAVPAQANADKFGVRFRGYLAIPETGIYTFYLTCDDGGTLRIADRLVVDNDGLHSAIEKSGQVALAKGLQPLALDFVEGGGGYTLLLKYSKDGSEPQPVPASWLKQ